MGGERSPDCAFQELADLRHRTGRSAQRTTGASDDVGVAVTLARHDGAQRAKELERRVDRIGVLNGGQLLARQRRPRASQPRCEPAVVLLRQCGQDGAQRRDIRRG